MHDPRKIKARLTELGLTQKDVAEALNIAPATASQKLNGIRPLYLDEAEKLFELLQLKDSQFRTYFFKS